MLIVIFLGLLAVAIGFWFLHRRYHRRREAHWNLGPASQPDINTWGPGQSVHDLDFGAGAASRDGEKGKAREQVNQVEQKQAGAKRGHRERRRGGRGKKTGEKDFSRFGNTNCLKLWGELDAWGNHWDMIMIDG